MLKTSSFCVKKCEINFRIQDINKLRLGLTGERRKNLDKSTNDFIKRNKEERLNYHKISYIKLSIGSSAVESLIRQAVIYVC